MPSVDMVLPSAYACIRPPSLNCNLYSLSYPLAAIAALCAEGCLHCSAGPLTCSHSPRELDSQHLSPVHSLRPAKPYLSPGIALCSSSQVLAILCVTPAFGIAVNKFDALDSIHAQMGIAIFIMMALQPVLAIMRPHKGSALRAVWYVTHWTLGMAAVALGWWNCFTGLQLYTEEWATDTTVRIAPWR